MAMDCKAQPNRNSGDAQPIDDSLFHSLWTKAVGLPGYDKHAWLALEKQVHAGLRSEAAKTDGAGPAVGNGPVSGGPAPVAPSLLADQAHPAESAPFGDPRMAETTRVPCEVPEHWSCGSISIHLDIDCETHRARVLRSSKVTPARLDADGTAEPLTELRAVVSKDAKLSVSDNQIEGYVVREAVPKASKTPVTWHTEEVPYGFQAFSRGGSPGIRTTGPIRDTLDEATRDRQAFESPLRRERAQPKGEPHASRDGDGHGAALAGRASGARSGEVGVEEHQLHEGQGQVSDPMTRKAAIKRIIAMRYDNHETWNLSPKDQEALRHAVQAFSDVDVLRKENVRLKDALRICGEAGCPTAAAINAVCGCGPGTDFELGIQNELDGLERANRVLIDALERINVNAGCLVRGAMCSPALCPGCIARRAVREATDAKGVAK